MSKLSLLDLGFFVAETEASPKHVAGLLIFKRPPKTTAAFVKRLYRQYLAASDVQPPFDQVIEFVRNGLPQWRSADHIEMARHVFFHKLPAAANDRRALYAFVAKLHEPVLDRTRPLWELHVIDGLGGDLGRGRFAIYQKMHHACADGVTMARWTAENLSTQPDDPSFAPIWTHQHAGHGALVRRRNRALMEVMRKQFASATLRLLGIGRLAAMLLLESVKLTKNAIAVPFASAIHTPLTGQVTGGRQFASVAIPMERIARIRNRTRSTLNHVALTCIDAALHGYLREQGVELDRPVTIQMPVNLRRDGDRKAGNRVGIVQVELSPPTDDAYVRLRNVGYSLRNVRQMTDSVAPEAIESYTLITALVAQTAELLKLSNSLPPMGNTLVSNVPGPKEPLYLQGALMEEMHPISTLPASNLLNITLFSYAGQLDFGLIATDQLPQLDRLAAQIEQAFDELEAAVIDAHAP